MRPGRRRLLAATLLLMAALGVFHAWSLFVVALELRLGLSRAAVSGVYAVAIGSFTLSMLMAPRIVRRMSPAVAAAGTGLVAALGLGLVGIGTTWALWVGYAGLFGIANGVGYSLALQIVQVALPARRGFATSLAVTAYAVGPAAFAPALELGVRRLGVLETLALVAAFVAVVGAVQLPLLAGVRLPAAVVAATADASGRIYDRTFWTLWLCFLLGSAAGLGVLAHAAAVVADLGGGATAAALGAALIALGNAMGRLVGGSLTDVVAVRWVLAAAGATGAAALLACVWLGSVLSGSVALAGTGLYYGVISSAFPAAVGRIYGVERLSLVYGRLFTAWGAAGLVAPVAAGFAFDRSGSYDAVLLAAGIAALGSVGVALALPRDGR